MLINKWSSSLLSVNKWILANFSIRSCLNWVDLLPNPNGDATIRTKVEFGPKTNSDLILKLGAEF